MKTLRPHQHGTTLLEVLITMVILAFGLLGLAAFQSKAQIGSIEAYQRAQAVVLLEDLQARMSNNPTAAAAYVTTTALGTPDTAQPANCAALAAGSARDRCEWSNALKGAAEFKGSASVGAMTGARGCVTELQAPNPASGVCTPGLYLLSVAWQGLHPTKAPLLACGKNEYGADTNRRAIAVRVAVGLPNCS